MTDPLWVVGRVLQAKRIDKADECGGGDAGVAMVRKRLVGTFF